MCIAVVVEKGFFDDENAYKDALMDIADVITGTIKSSMKQGGIDIFVFGDTNSDLARGILFSLIKFNIFLF